MNPASRTLARLEQGHMVKWNGHWFLLDEAQTEILSLAFDGTWEPHFIRPMMDMQAIIMMLREAEHFVQPGLNLWNITAEMTFEQNHAGWILYLREVWKKGQGPHELETVIYE